MASHQFDLDVHARGKLELFQSGHGFGRGTVDFDHTLVRDDLELLARLFVDVRRTQNSEDLLLCGQRNRTGYDSTAVAHRFDDFLRRLVDQTVVVRTKLDTDFLIHTS